jgi:hypothetical protein
MNFFPAPGFFGSSVNRTLMFSASQFLKKTPSKKTGFPVWLPHTTSFLSSMARKYLMLAMYPS